MRVRSREARARAEAAVGRGRGDGGGNGGGAHHVLDGPDAGDGVLGEREGHGDGAGQFAIDIDGAAAHALHDAGMFERAAGEPGQDEGFLGAEIVEHAEDFDLEFVDAVAGEDGAAGAAHAGSDVLQGKKEAGLGEEGQRARGAAGTRKARHILIVIARAWHAEIRDNGV